MRPRSVVPRRRGVPAAAALVAALVAALATALLAPPAAGAQEVRVRDLTVEEGSVPVRLMGYGLVVGLAGTGDRPGGGRGAVHTVQSVANLLRRFDVEVPPELLATRNVAAVLVTAEVSPWLRPGARFEVQVASVGDARSLRGGVLYTTPLVAEAGGAGLASAQGPLLFAAARARWGDPASAAPVPGGGVLEVALPRPPTAAGDRLLLRRPDRVTATRIAETINAALGGRPARVEDPGAVRLALDDDESTRAGQLARIAELRLGAAPTARLVLDARDGSVAVGGALAVGAGTVTSGGVTLAVGGASVVADSAAPAVRVREGATVQDVVAALGAFRLRPEEIAAMLRGLADVGALAAEVTLR